ncbi:hypothetical protein N7510_008048 [Penicillium lagena]|uniref:uncharacterized protein n=1 Tax=Penicillium lagena TaxID=94218 RepID=UPI002540ECF2|nr:uncharacterized protein N7510_008048 [Penicillium lagena]KAJ5611329.1 hypothetical protein N7510_008048 [Penicillium lagena]
MASEPPLVATDEHLLRYFDMTSAEKQALELEQQDQSGQQSPQTLRSPTTPRGGTNRPAPLANALPLLLLDGADTLVQTIPHRVHSEKLLSSGSTFFKRATQPRYQTQVRKRRGWVDRLPTGIKYVIDLTPPDADEDAIIFMTELSCPMAIRTWALQKTLWSLPSECVGGKDEITWPEQTEDPLDPLLMSDDDNVLSKMQNFPETTTRDFLKSRIQKYGLPVEYSPHRHREGIEYILHVLEDLNPRIDTPCKIWTFYGLAKIFDVLTVPAISNHLVSWFYDSTNAKIIQFYPEIAYRVGRGLQAPALCRDSFVGLVADEALLYLVRAANQRPLDRNQYQTLTCSRIRDFLDDTEVQRIEYASKSFADHVVNRFLHLIGEEMSWLNGLAEFQKLTSHLGQWPRDRDVVLMLILTVKNYIRSRLYAELRKTRDTARTMPAIPSESDDTLGGFVPYNDVNHHAPGVIYQRQHILQRILGRGFWNSLLGVTLSGDSENQSIVNAGLQGHRSILELGNGLPAFRDQGFAVIRRVSIDEIWSRVEDFNQTVYRQSACGIMSTTETPRLNYFNPPAMPTWNLVTNLRRPGHDYRSSQADRGGDSTWNSETSGDSLGSPGPTLIKPGPTMNLVTGLQRPGLVAGSSRAAVAGAHAAGSEISPFFPFDLSGPNTPPQNRAPGPIMNDPIARKYPPDEGRARQPKTFELRVFFDQVSEYLVKYAHDMLYSEEISLVDFKHLNTLCVLTDNEYRFLPLWAGGNDDGTGGVFTDHDIPIMETGGFSTPGPAVRTGSLASTQDSFSEINPSDSQSTIQRASHEATNSHVSEVMSVDSMELTNESGQTHVSAVNYDDANLSDWSMEDTEEELDLDSDSTVVTGSASDVGDFDMDEDENVGFELVDGQH